MERILIDMDEVLADPISPAIDWYRKNYEGEIDFEKMLAGSWVKGFPESHQPLITEQLHSPGYFRHLPVIKDAPEVLREINERYELFIVSAAVQFPYSLKDKVDWLKDHFPFIHWKQITLCGDKRLVSGDHMIDDHDWNLEHFDGKKYLFTSPHNLTVTGYHRLNNWQEAADVFLK